MVRLGLPAELHPKRVVAKDFGVGQAHHLLGLLNRALEVRVCKVDSPELESEETLLFLDRSPRTWINGTLTGRSCRRRINSVMNALPRLSLWEKTCEMASRTELFPADWSPEAIISGESTYLLIPLRQVYR